MTNNQNQPTKAEVQTTKLNKVPFATNADTEFSAEDAAEAFEQAPSANQQQKQQHQSNTQE